MPNFRIKINCFKAASHLGYLLVLLFWVTVVQAEDLEKIDDQLITAAEKGNLPMVRRILETEHALPPATINAALFAGIKKGSKPIVQLLLDRGGDANFRGDNGYTAVIQAARDGRANLVELLLSLGAEVNATASETNETALILAAKRDRREVMDLLISAHADLEARRADGMTALMLAARGGHQMAAHKLIEAGAAVNVQLEHGATPLMLAAQHGHLSVVYVLLAANADPNIKASNGATALTLANAYRHGEVAEMLKKAGAH